MQTTARKTCLACEDATCSRLCKCTIDGKPIEEHEAAWECPLGKFPDRGLGDTVKRVLDATRIGPAVKRVIERVTRKPCGCESRREALNELVHFAKE